MATALEGLPPLVVVTGKGGVGKTVVSCALARLRAASGDRVLLLELDSRESMHVFLGSSPSGGDVVRVASGLDVRSLRPRAVLDALIASRVRPQWVAKRVLASTIYDHFVEGAPGLRETAALGYARQATRLGGGAYDLVVLDAPATGHGVALLEAPRLLQQAIAGGPLAELAEEVAVLVEGRDSSALWAVATAEGMALRETLELDQRLSAGLGRGLDRLLLNRLLPAPAAQDDTPAWLELWRRRASTQQERIARLRAAWSRPLIGLPRAVGDGADVLEVVASALAAEPSP